MPDDMRGPDLEVHLPALREASGMLDRQATASKQCGDHLEEAYGAMDAGRGPLRNATAGIINYLAGTHNRIRGDVRDYFDEVDVFAAGQAEQVRESVEMFESTDMEIAAMLDASLFLPERRALVEELGRSAELDPDREMAVGPEPYDPADALKELVDYRAEMPYEPGWSNDYRYGLVRATIWDVTQLAAKLGLLSEPYDVVTGILIPFTGDWAGLKTCSDVHEDLAGATRRLHANAGWIEQRIDAVWKGNAADACWLNVRMLRRSLAHTPDILDGYASAYQDVVVKVKEQERKAAEVLEELLDWAVVALLSLELGGWPTGVKLGVYVGWPPLPPSKFFKNLWTALVEVVKRIFFLTDIIQLAIQAVWDFEARCELGMLHGPKVGASLPSVPESTAGYH